MQLICLIQKSLRRSNELWAYISRLFEELLFFFVAESSLPVAISDT